MPAKATGSSSASPPRTYLSIIRPFRWTGTSLSTKGKLLNSRSARAPRACRRRTLPASSLTNVGPSRPPRRTGRTRSLAASAPQVPEANKEAVVQVLSEGQCIKHEQYGYGIVAESDTERTKIDFDSVGMKKFVTGLMAMELVGEAPERPTKPRRRSKKAGATAAAKVAAASK